MNKPKIDRMDQVALIVGVCGFVSMLIGVACISVAIALIVAGVGLMGWSYMMARAVALTKRRPSQSPDQNH